MLITCIAHSMFLIELDSGLRIVTDPVDDGSGYPVKPVKADVVLVSHGHHDHCALEKVTSYTSVVNEAGCYTPETGVSIEAVQAWHDDAQGTKRGPTLLFVIKAEGVKLAHLGDLGHLPTENQKQFLKDTDLLMIPVGGFFTIDAKCAAETAEAIHARTILPMHYRTKYNEGWPIAPLENFTTQYPVEEIRVQPLLRTVREDLCCLSRICVLQPQLQG